MFDKRLRPEPKEELLCPMPVGAVPNRIGRGRVESDEDEQEAVDIELVERVP